MPFVRKVSSSPNLQLGGAELPAQAPKFVRRASYAPSTGATLSGDSTPLMLRTYGAEQPTNFDRYIAAPFGRGVDRFQGLASLALGDYEGFAAQTREAETSLQLTRDDQQTMRQISDAETLWDALKLYGKNPRLIAAVASESLGLFAPTAGAALAGGALGTGTLGAAAIVGLGSGTTEYLNTMAEVARERGADPRSGKSMERMFDDETFLSEARERAIKRGVPIAALDAVSVGLAGKIFTTAGKGLAGRVLGATGELGAQGAYGGTGEALAQLAEFGRVYAPGEVAGEIVGELGTGPVDILTAAVARAKPRAPDTNVPPVDLPDGATSPPVDPGDVMIGEIEEGQETISPAEAQIEREAEAAMRGEDTTGVFLPDRPVTPATPLSEAPVEDLAGVEPEAEVAAEAEPEVVVEPEPEVSTGVEAPNIAAFQSDGKTIKPVITALLGSFKRRGNREVEIFRGRAEDVTSKDSRTKIRPQALIKEDLLKIYEALGGEQALGFTAPPIKSRLDQTKWAVFIEQLALAQPSPQRQQALVNALRFDDPYTVHSALDELSSRAAGRLDNPVIGTEFESIRSQYEGFRNEVVEAFNPERKKVGEVKDNQEQLGSLQSFYALVYELFRQIGKVPPIGANPETMARSLEKQPKYIKKVGTDLAEYYRKLYNRTDVSKPFRQEAFERLLEIGDQLVDRRNKALDERDAKRQEMGTPIAEQRREDAILQRQQRMRDKKIPQRRSEEVKGATPQEEANLRQQAAEFEDLRAGQRNTQTPPRNRVVVEDTEIPPGGALPRRPGRETERAPRPESTKEAKGKGVSKLVPQQPTAEEQLTAAAKKAQAEQKAKRSAASKKGWQTRRGMVTVPEREFTPRQKIMSLLGLQPVDVERSPLLGRLLPWGSSTQDRAAGTVARLLKALNPTQRAEFWGLQNLYINTPAISAELEPSFRTTEERLAGVQPSGALEVLESDITGWVENTVTNPEGIANDIIDLWRRMRTVQREGHDAGTIVLRQEGRNTDETAAALTALEPDFEALFKPDFFSSIPDVELNAAQQKLFHSVISSQYQPSGKSSQRLLRKIQALLPDNHPWQPAFERAISTGIDIPVVTALAMPVVWRNTKTGALSAEYGRYTMKMKEPDARLIFLFEPVETSGYTGAALVRTLLHEMHHAATKARYLADPVYREAWNDAYDQIKARVGETKWRGMVDTEEMMSEVFANPAFRKFLEGVNIGPTITVETQVGPRNMLERVLDLILKAFNRRFTRTVSRVEQRTALGMLLDLDTRFDISTEAEVIKYTNMGIDAQQDRSSALREEIQKVDRQSSIWTEKLREAGRAGNLMFSDLNVIVRNNSKLITRAMKAVDMKGTNLLTRFRKAVLDTSASAKELENQFLGVTELTKQLNKDQHRELGTAMDVLTRAKVDPTQPVNSAAQPWLYNKAGRLFNKELVNEAKQNFNALGKPVKKALLALRELMQVARTMRRRALLRHALRTRFSDTISQSNLDALANADSLETLQLALSAGLTDINGEAVDTAKVLQTAEQVFALGEIPGTYFPLKRNGEHVVSIEDENPEEAYFAFFDTEFEAKEHIKQLEAAGIKDAKWSPKIEKSGFAKMTGQQLRQLEDLLPKAELEQDVDGKNTYRDVMQQAILKLMGDRILYSAQLKRENVPGAQPEDMIKNVEDYVRSTISTVSSLQGAYDVQQSLYGFSRMYETESAVADADKRQIKAIHHELLKRVRIMGEARDVLVVDQILGGLGFYHYLGAPSYWILNATQTAVVGIPILASLAGRALGRNVGFIEATKAMGRAYKVLQQATKGLGWKALADMEAVKDRLTPEQAKVLTLLEADGILQSTLAHEFNLLAQGPLYNNVTQILTTMPDMIERWNRSAMALAGMELGMTAENYDVLAEITETSQFNYDPLNRARGLRGSGTLRHVVAPMMMFKVFGVNMARVVYGTLWNMLTGDSKNGGFSREESRKIFVGLLGSHTLAGGMFGGLGLGMAQMVGTAINATLDPEDEIDWATALDEFIADHTNDYIARIVTRGLPAAVGADMSASTNLGNLIFMTSDVDFARYGGFEQYAYSLLGPVAQYIAGSTREGAQLMAGEATLADFAEKAVPLKAYRAMSQAMRQQIQGLETGQGYQFLDPDDLNLGDFAIQALGLRPAQVSQRQDRFYAARSFERTLGSRKARLMDDFVRADNASERKRARNNIREWNATQRRRRNFGMIITSDSLSRSRRNRFDRQWRYDRGEFSSVR